MMYNAQVMFLLTDASHVHEIGFNNPTVALDSSLILWLLKNVYFPPKNIEDHQSIKLAFKNMIKNGNDILFAQYFSCITFCIGICPKLFLKRTVLISTYARVHKYQIEFFKV